VRSYNKYKRGVCAKKGKGLPIVERRKRGGKRIHSRVVEEGIYPAVKVTTNGTGILCRKEGQKEMDGIGLQVFE